jgi:hypothetical protein
MDKFQAALEILNLVCWASVVIISLVLLKRSYTQDQNQESDQE